eukprot:649903-Prorocentrum_minimum.AAC.1
MQRSSVLSEIERLEVGILLLPPPSLSKCNAPLCCPRLSAWRWASSFYPPSSPNAALLCAVGD